MGRKCSFAVNAVRYRKRNGVTVLDNTRRLSQTPTARRLRSLRAKIQFILEPRICCWCHYAFISKGGRNYCSDCLRDFAYEFSRKELYRIWVRPIPSYWMKWVRIQYGGIRVEDVSLHAKIPVPDKNSPRFQSALSQTLDLMEKSIRDDVWYVNAMPRLIGLSPYRVVKEDEVA